MTINKFQGKTEEEAIALAKEKMGQDVLIMSTRVVKPKGLFGFLKTSMYEVTAALDERNTAVSAAVTPRTVSKPSEIAVKEGTIDLSADEELSLNDLHDTAYKPAESITYTNKRKADTAKTEVLTGQKTVTDKVPTHSQNDIMSETDYIEERLGNLQNLLEQTLAEDSRQKPKNETFTGYDHKFTEDNGLREGENPAFIKTLYRILLNNEVDERYINKLLDDLMKVIRGSSSIDHILSNVYQKMVLNFGDTREIETEGKKPKIVFFIGPTGVGKTTTIAKIASRYKVGEGKSVAFLSADTYRIAAADQLKTYANILEAPLNIIYKPEELYVAIEEFRNYDMIFVDTAGFSHKNTSQKEDTAELIKNVPAGLDVTVYLVLSLVTKYRDLKEICDTYRQISDYSLIFTKLDETDVYGNLYNISQYTGSSISYVTNGQNVPDDISVFDTQATVKALLGGDNGGE
ncbi:MAG: flagellar biosynthesis protein FlhF [Lachnospiraceae bacterium]|nr:flagellar biosynthesis protein FlhF [Lachnospiraceae bacterium]